MKLKFTIPAAILLFLLLYILLLSVRPLFSPDEYRYIEIPREMLADHDFVTPRLNGARYFEKPVMGYWLIAGAIKVFGKNAFAARFAPAVSTGLAALIVALLGAKLTGRREQGWYAAVCFLVMPLVFIVGTTCSLDAVFSFFVTATIASFYCASECCREKQKRTHLLLWLLATGGAAGCAFLVKGFLAFVLPVMAVLPWMIWEKRWKEIFTLPWLPFVVALAVIAPWAILIHRAEPDYWRYFVMEEHFARFFGGVEAEHPHGPFFFVLILLAGAAEWFLLSPAIGYGVGKIGVRGEKNSWFRFLICWFAGPFLFLSASSGKLPTYILPCFPALAIMISAALFRYFERDRPDGKGRDKLFDLPLLVFVVLGLIAGPVALIVIFHVLPKYFDVALYGGGETGKSLIMIVAFVLVLSGVVAAFSAKQPVRKLSCFIAAVVPVFVVAFFVVPKSFYDARTMDVFLEECRDEITPDTVIIAKGSCCQAVCCVYERNDIYIIAPGELTYGLSYPEDKHRDLAVHLLKQFFAEHPGQKVVMFFSADRYYRLCQENKFPPALSVKKSIPDDPEDKHANGKVMVRFQ